LSELRLVAPGLAALIVCLAMRFRMSHAKIREFLWEWLALSISVGTISKTIHEAGAAVVPAEEEIHAKLLTVVTERIPRRFGFDPIHEIKS
jgi:hypothetical protein